MEASQTTPVEPAAPEQPLTTEDILRSILEEQRQHREEVAQLRREINASKPSVPVQVTQTPRTPEEALAARMQDINQHPYYCPGCGKLVDYRQQCTGTGEKPHQPIEVVSTDELKSGDPSQHTTAPALA